MSLPATLTIATAAGTAASESLCTAFLEAYGLICVSRTWYEVTHVSPRADAEGRWTWKLRLARDVGRA